MPVVVRTTLSREEVSDLIYAVVGSLAGTSEVAADVARSAYIVMAVEFFSLVKDAYITKARGGTDEAGIKWPPLTKKYLAYGRGPASSRRIGGHSPMGGDGALSKQEVKRWWEFYNRAKAWLAADGLEGRELKGRAAAIAWDKIKREGGKTKLQILGNRPHEILRDTNALINSLSPGIPSTNSYQAPDGQIFDPAPGNIGLGTNVPYAAAHHFGIGVPKRQLWPDGDQIPSSWWAQMLAPVVQVMAAGLVRKLQEPQQ